MIEPEGKKASVVLELDGLRAIAVLCVMAFHAPYMFEGCRWASVALKGWTRAGWIGVDLFFALSGYLITRGLIFTRNAPRYLARFWAARVTRIAPLYYVYIAGVFALAPRGGHLLSPHADPTLYLVYLGNLPRSMGLIQGDLVDVTWSLSIEEHFYLLWPFVVRRYDTSKLLRICAGAAAFAALCRVLWPTQDAAYFATPCRLDALAAGSALACIAQRHGDEAVAAWCRARVWPAALTVACVVLPTHPAATVPFTAPELRVLGYCLIAASCAVFVGAVGFGAKPWAPLRARWLTHIGRVSYGVYLLHFTVGGVVDGMRPLARLLPMELWLLVAIVLTVALATVARHVVEVPALRLRRYLA